MVNTRMYTRYTSVIHGTPTYVTHENEVLYIKVTLNLYLLDITENKNITTLLKEKDIVDNLSLFEWIFQNERLEWSKWMDERMNE